MATLGIFCMSRSPDAKMGASEGLHYLFKVLVLHRSKWGAPGGCGGPVTAAGGTH